MTMPHLINCAHWEEKQFEPEGFPDESLTEILNDMADRCGLADNGRVGFVKNLQGRIRAAMQQEDGGSYAEYLYHKALCLRSLSVDTEQVKAISL